MKVRRMLSGFWAVHSHGKLQSAFWNHADALAYAVALPGYGAKIRSAMGDLVNRRATWPASGACPDE